MRTTSSLSHRRGQIFSLDVLIASAILLLVLFVSIVVWAAADTRRAQFEEYRWMEWGARDASSALISTPGDPADWENLADEDFDANAHAVGLARERNVLDSRKLARLSELNSTKYFEIKTLLGLAKYDVRLSVVNASGNEVWVWGAGPGAGDEKGALVIDRLALLNGD
ncbi:MAG: hypothetical protein AB1468_05480, partial [Candidatus Micrarchaeota archaeon]